MDILEGVALLALASLLLAGGLHTAEQVYAAKKLARQAKRYASTPPEAKRSILVIGDSTAYGTGASDPKHSVAGRLAADYPTVRIENYSENGMNLRQLAALLTTLQSKRYDLIVVHIGGIDVLSLTSRRTLEHLFQEVLSLTQAMTGGKTILVSPMNVGNALMFWFPISLLFRYHTGVVRTICRQVCEKLGVTYVDLYRTERDDQFFHNPKLFAADGIHPNDDGYAVWYEKIKQSVHDQLSG